MAAVLTCHLPGTRRNVAVYCKRGEFRGLCWAIDCWNESSFNMYTSNWLLSERRKLLLLALLVRETLRVLAFAIRMWHLNKCFVASLPRRITCWTPPGPAEYYCQLFQLRLTKLFSNFAFYVKHTYVIYSFVWELGTSGPIRSRVVVIPYRRFGRIYLPHLQGSIIQEACCVTAKKSTVLVYFATEPWNNAWFCLFGDHLSITLTSVSRIIFKICTLVWGISNNFLNTLK
jgi:hypothetical protein